MHPNAEALLKFFEYDHLPPNLAEISEEFWATAHRLVGDKPEGWGLDGPEMTACLRKLLEAKDCAVRAALS